MTTNKKNPKVKKHPESYEEFDRFEIINNTRYELKPSPTVKHQHFVTQLSYALYSTCHQNGVILVAPIDIYFNEENIFQPDLLYISNEHSEIIKEARIEGSPDLVVEILSPSTSKNDKIHKKEQYERFGVTEYWIVDPVHFIIDQFVLEKDKYQLAATFGEGDTVTSENFPCIFIDLVSLFERIRR